jgi:hypothetical protein
VRAALKFFQARFSRKGDPLREQAEMLVDAAQVNATASFVPLLDKFPVLKNVDVEHWDFILTVAGVFVAATRLRNMNFGDAREDKLMAIVSERMVAWNPTHGISGFEHCKSFFERTFDGLTRAGHEARFVASDSIGAWIVWDVLNRAPETDEERQLVRAVGAIVTHEFYNWWKAN